MSEGYQMSEMSEGYQVSVQCAGNPGTHDEETITTITI